MSQPRQTFDFGIDLGTTNSAIAVLNGVTPKIIKNFLDDDITPSAVSINKRQELVVGKSAKDKLKRFPPRSSQPSAATCNAPSAKNPSPP